MHLLYLFNQICIFLYSIMETNSCSNRLDRLLRFLIYHNVRSEDIWDFSSCSFLTISGFASALQQKFGYSFNVNELMALQKLADNEGKLYVDNFQEFGLWNSSYFQYRKIKMARPKTAQQFGRKQNQNFKAMDSFNAVSQVSQMKNTQLLKSNKFREANEVLEKKILENTLDKKWEYLIKVGQMNSWKKNQRIQAQKCQTKQPAQSEAHSKRHKYYKIEDSEQDIKIMEENQEGAFEVLPLKVFDQKYQSIKKKVTKQKLKNNMKGTMLLVLDKKDKVTKTKLCQRISQRDQQLNYLLLEIIRTKNIFEQQQQILAQCGVNT